MRGDDGGMLVDDLVVLGNAVPNEISGGRKTVCTAGYSEKHGLMRVYPVPPKSDMKRWNVVRVPLERNPSDTRGESWKIPGSRGEWDRLASKITSSRRLTRKEQLGLRRKIEASHGVGCVKDLNDRKLSLGIIRPAWMEPVLVKRERRESSVQTTLFSSEPFVTVQNYAVQPRLRYRCSGCRSKNGHDQQVLEWGAYEWIRNNPGNMGQVWDNMGINRPGYDTSLLVGNLSLHRTSFVVISVLRHKAAA